MRRQNQNRIRVHNGGLPVISLDMRYTLRHKCFWKPGGLFYSLDFSWLYWMKYEMPHWIERYNFELEIDVSRILIVDSPKQLTELPRTVFEDQIIIDFEKLKQHWCGIEIPNQNELKYAEYGHTFSLRRGSHFADTLFIDSLDCDSGIIWDLSAVKNVRPLSIKEVSKRMKTIYG